MAIITLEKKYCYDEMKRHLRQYMALHRDYERHYQAQETLRSRSNQLVARFLYLTKDSFAQEVRRNNLKEFCKEVSIDLELENGVETVDYYLKNIISKVNNDVLREVLVHRYLGKKPWCRIMKEMNYSWAQIHRLHNEALNHLVVITRAG